MRVKHDTTEKCVVKSPAFCFLLIFFFFCELTSKATYCNQPAEISQNLLLSQLPVCFAYVFVLFFYEHSRDVREHLEGRKIRGLTFRLMPEAVLALTLSFGSKDDQFLSVCKDWIDAVLPGPARTHVGSGSERDEQD